MYISPVPYLVVGFSEDQIFYSQNNEKKNKKNLTRISWMSGLIWTVTVRVLQFVRLLVRRLSDHLISKF